MKRMMKRSQDYVRKKKVVVNTEMTKMMVYRKGGRKKKTAWRCDKEVIDTVKDGKYLWKLMRYNNDKDAQTKIIA